MEKIILGRKKEKSVLCVCVCVRACVRARAHFLLSSQKFILSANKHF